MIGSREMHAGSAIRTPVYWGCEDGETRRQCEADLILHVALQPEAVIPGVHEEKGSLRTIESLPGTAVLQDD